MRTSQAVAPAILAAAIGCAGTHDEPRGLEIRGATMGTTYAVRVDDAAAGASEAAIRAGVEDTLARVDALMSTYRHDSEISRLNRAPAGQPVDLSEETLRVLSAAQALSRDSGGAFDATAGALVNAWGFGPPGSDVRPPDDEELERIRQQVGWDKLTLDRDARAATRSASGLSVDLSAIAKGYAVDAVIEALEELGFSRLLVEVGGEVGARGTTASGRTWRVGIERPDAGSGGLQRRLELRNAALATSGNYRNYYLLDGGVVGHTIDPRTGRPAGHATGSVSVIAADCMTADGLATALMVLGPVEGLVWAEEREIAALFVLREGDELVERPTRAFANLLRVAEREGATS